MKALGQVGLDFISNKYKELKNSLKDYAKKSDLDNKIDKSQISLNANDVDSDKVTSAMTTNMLYSMISKHENIYSDEDKAKVKAIPANPKYTDTVTEVVDNLTTSDSTKALSAKQGKTLNDSLSGKADKSDISRCKAKGYSSASSWSSASSSRDLEDWIGDFDKRTRELKNNKGLTGDRSEISQQVIPCSSARNCDLVAKKWGRYVELSFYFNYDENSTTRSSWEFMIPEKFMPGGNAYGKLSNGEYELISPSNSSEARLTVTKEYGLRGGLIAGNIIFLARNQ